MSLKTLEINSHISEIICINNLQFPYHFLDNTNIITYSSIPKIFKIGLLYSFLIGVVLGKIGLYFKNSSIGKFVINNMNIYILKYISIRILNLSLFWKLFIFLLCLFIVIDIYQIYYYNGVINYDWELIKTVLNMAEDNNKPVVDASHSLVNSHTPVANVTVPVEAAKMTSTAFTTAAGMKAGLDLAKIVPGIGDKSVVFVGTTIVAQAINITVNKLNIYSPSSSASETKNSFISDDIYQFINGKSNNSKINDKFSEYPYNLIPDLNMYINIEIWFLIILINVLVTAYLLEKNRYK